MPDSTTSDTAAMRMYADRISLAQQIAAPKIWAQHLPILQFSAHRAQIAKHMAVGSAAYKVI